MDVTAIIVAASIPSALTGFFFWLIEQSIQKRADNAGNCTDYGRSVRGGLHHRGRLDRLR